MSLPSSAPLPAASRVVLPQQRKTHPHPVPLHTASHIHTHAHIAGLLMAPGVRYGRLLQAFLEPPCWAQGLSPSTPDKLLVQAGFALQLLLLPLWVPSMADVLRLPAASLPLLRGTVMLLAGLLQAWAMPALLQVCVRAVGVHASLLPHTAHTVLLLQPHLQGATSTSAWRVWSARPLLTRPASVSLPCLPVSLLLCPCLVCLCVCPCLCRRSCTAPPCMRTSPPATLPPLPS